MQIRLPQPGFIQEYRTTHPNWKRIGMLQIMAHGIAAITHYLKEPDSRNGGTTWERPVVLLSHPALIFTFDESTIQFHLPAGRSHSHLSDCCEKLVAAGLTEADQENCIVYVNQFETLSSKTGCICIKRGPGPKDIEMLLTDAIAGKLARLPEFSRNAHLYELLKPDKLNSQVTSPYIDGVRLVSRGEHTFEVSVLLESQMLWVDLVDQRASFPVQIGLLVEKTGLAFDVSTTHQQALMNGISKTFAVELNKNSGCVSPSGNADGDDVEDLATSVAIRKWSDFKAELLNGVEKLLQKRKQQQKKAPHVNLEEYNRKTNEYMARYDLTQKQARVVVLQYEFRMNESESALFLKVARKTITEHRAAATKKLSRK